ncbi:dihydroxyacetone kinase [Marinobacter sp. LV10R510-11A]|uniref:dihydroxyacetone kinase subunit DhaK n=1 Tax=Marinobacter sp. LV10R510-11A TaxID=1415568 RepID=UPI000BB8A66B|nr:dihydroxyacetone kinase subunit DhaK [Marinobacter sp. LV10R510-11A]SOB77212.1 dihydroxyacetone kinase [Marinobacter sp. LV10R510-11A]
MSQFINKKENIVTEAVDGLIRASGGQLARLDGYPHIRVVVRADWDKSKVALVSGGGSGHEPAHAGFVGKGMLTAAVCGDVFASPSVDAVLAGILAVTGPAGCLLIVKNYTGDRLNFGLAAERARAAGYKVSMVVVDDDIALPDLPQARGVAGTLFVYKIAGALAEQGADLDTLTKAAERVVRDTQSIGMSLDTCTVPGSPRQQRIPPGIAELGLGIHGEPGVEQVAYNGAKNAIEAVAAKLATVMDKKTHVVLLNNLGGASTLEMSVLANELLVSSIADNLKLIIGPAPMMTSLDMRGFSVSVYAVNNEDEALLGAPCAPSAWPGCKAVNSVIIKELPDGLTPVKLVPSWHEPTANFITRWCQVLIDSEADLNALDAKSGDGDTGATLAGAAKALISALDRMPLSDPTQLYRAIGQELSQTMGGSCGVLLSIFFTATADAASSGLPMVASLKEGLDRMQQIGGAQLGDRSMVDARKGAVHTSTIVKARVGRASYINAEQLQGHIDPGAEAVARLFEDLGDRG